MKVVQAGGIYVLANITSAAVPFLLLPVLTRVIDPAGYGHIVNFALLVTVCSAFAGLNAHAALGVLWFRRPHNQMPFFVGTGLGLVAVSTIVVACLAAVTLWNSPDFARGLSPVWGAVAAMTAGANVVSQCRLVLWQSQVKPVHSAFLQIGGSVLNVGLSLIAIFALGWGGDGRNAGIAAGALLTAFAALGSFLISREIRWAPDSAQLTTLVAFGTPLIFHTLAGVSLSTADRWIVAVEFDSHTLGVYGAAAQLGMIMAILADAFMKAYGPWLSAKLASTHSDDKYHAVGAIYIAMPAFLCVAALVGVAAFWASSVLLGPQYRAAAWLLPWFVLGGAFTGVYLCTSVLFFFSGRTGLLALVTLSSAVVGVTITWLMVATFGVSGAAAGYAITQGFLALLVTVVACKSFDLPWREVRKATTIWAHRTFDLLRRAPV